MCFLPVLQFTAAIPHLTVIYKNYHHESERKRQNAWLHIAAKALSSMPVDAGPQGGRTFQKVEQQLKKACKMIFSERFFKWLGVQNRHQSWNSCILIHYKHQSMSEKTMQSLCSKVQKIVQQSCESSGTTIKRQMVLEVQIVAPLPLKDTKQLTNAPR